MISFNESLYGWGVCNIPMPRSTQDIFSDRRKNRGRGPGVNRRRRRELPGVVAAVSGAMGHDVPWRQTVTVGFFALFSIAFVFLISTMLPDMVEEEIPEPVEIMIKLMADRPEKSTFTAPRPPVQGEPAEPSVQLEQTVRAVKEPPRLPVKTAPLPILKKEVVPEETLPEIQIRPRLRDKRPRLEKTLVPRATSLQEVRLPEDVAVSTAAVSRERYRHPDRMPAEDRPQPLDSEPRFMSHQPREAPRIAPASQQTQRTYEIQTQAQPVIVASRETDLSARTPDVPIATDMTASRSQKVYQRTVKEPSVMVVPDKAGSLLPASEAPVAEVAPATQSQKNYTAGVSENRTLVPVDTTGPLLTDTEAPVAVIASAKQPRKNYQVDAIRPVVIAPADKTGPLLDQPRVPAADIAPVEQSRKNYQVSAEDRDVSMPSIPSDPLLPGSDHPEATVDPVSRPQRSYAHAETALDRVDAAEERSVSFGDVKLSDIDPAHLIQLKELAVCADPEAEFRLKTKLAVLLMGPAQCESNGMLLFFKYPESGYTIRVEIYNPGGVVLEDRCSVLQLAVDCIQDQKAKGVIP